MNHPREIQTLALAWDVRSYCALLALMLLQACFPNSEPATSATSGPVVSRLNEAHHLAVDFYGEPVGPDAAPAEKLIVSKIVVRDTSSREVAGFVPQDVESLQTSFGFFTEVWSPDGAYLVLPLGRFEGFALFSSKTALRDLAQKRSHDTLRVRLSRADSPMLWHSFRGWSAPHTLHFSAGLSGAEVEFTFDPASGEVQGKTDAADSFRVVTKRGVSSIMGVPGAR